MSSVSCYLMLLVFFKLVENNTTAPESSSTISSDIDAAGVKFDCDEVCETSGRRKSEVALLDLYSGCGAMSTGLCLGANLSGLNLVTVSFSFLLFMYV